MKVNNLLFNTLLNARFLFDIDIVAAYFPNAKFVNHVQTKTQTKY